MLEILLTGTGFAFAAAIQPGPLQAFLFSKVTQHGWKHTLPASFAPIISDGPIAFLILLILNRFPHYFINYMQTAGGVLLIYLALSAYRQSRKAVAENPAVKTQPRTLLQAVAVNFLNPGPYLGWSLILGPLVIKYWQADPFYSVLLVSSFYFTMTVTLAATILVFGLTKFLNRSVQKNLVLISGIILAFLGLYQLAGGVISLLK